MQQEALAATGGMDESTGNLEARRQAGSLRAARGWLGRHVGGAGPGGWVSAEASGGGGGLWVLLVE